MQAVTELELWTQNQADHAKIKEDISEIKESVAALKGAQSMLQPLLKFVVLPLILVVGTLVGAAELITKMVR